MANIEKRTNLSPQRIERNERIAKTTAKFPLLGDLMTSQNKDVVLDRHCFKSIKNAIKSKTIKLSEIEEGYGENSASVLLVPYMIHIQEACGLSEMLPIQAKMLAVTLYKELYFLTIAELAVFVMNVCTGKYGEFYGRLTAPIVGNAARQFKIERSKALDDIEKEEKGATSEIMFNKASAVLAEMPEYFMDPETGEKRRSNMYSMLDKQKKKLAARQAVRQVQDEKKDGVREEMSGIMQQLAQLPEDSPEREKLEARFAELGDKLI